MKWEKAVWAECGGQCPFRHSNFFLHIQSLLKKKSFFSLWFDFFSSPNKKSKFVVGVYSIFMLYYSKNCMEWDEQEWELLKSLFVKSTELKFFFWFVVVFFCCFAKKLTKKTLKPSRFRSREVKKISSNIFLRFIL